VSATAGEIEKDRVRRILHVLEKSYPDARCALVFSNPLECLVATVLSAQCTDARVNIVTRDLFRKYRLAREFAAVPRETLEEEIRSTGFFHSKAKSIQGLCAAIVRDHGGEVPASMEALVALPGVGRKTANLVLGEAFGVTSGIVVDTHVHRVSRRLGLTKVDDPEKIERDLMAIVPSDQWIAFGTRMIAHGRKLCDARAPKCAACPLLPDCPHGRTEAPSRWAAKPKKVLTRGPRRA
jgi:endonuclease-3